MNSLYLPLVGWAWWTVKYWLQTIEKTSINTNDKYIYLTTFVAGSSNLVYIYTKARQGNFKD